jgi:hypothetical protein
MIDPFLHCSLVTHVSDTLQGLLSMSTHGRDDVGRIGESSDGSFSTGCDCIGQIVHVETTSNYAGEGRL